MQTPLVPKGVEDEKGSRDPPLVKRLRPRALHGRRAENARPTYCWKMTREEKRKRKKKKMWTSSSKNDQRDWTDAASPSEHWERVLPSSKSLKRAEKTGSNWITVSADVVRVKGNGKERDKRTAECPAVYYMKRSRGAHLHTQQNESSSFCSRTLRFLNSGCRYMKYGCKESWFEAFFCYNYFCY